MSTRHYMDIDAISACPVCGGTAFEHIYPDYAGLCITTSMLFFEDVRLENRCCHQCGFIFNQGGIRGKGEKIFHTEGWKPRPQILAFNQGGKKPLQKKALEIFQKMVDVEPHGRMLDFGAGAGQFLRFFQEEYPGWELTALEPGCGYAKLVESVRLKAAYNCSYDQAPAEGPYDCVVIMSILEHVPDPMHALRWVYDRLKPDGLLLTRHPNFVHLPGDLFCADHLNKLTVPHTRAMLRASGFDVTAEDEQTLLFYMVCRKTSRPQSPKIRCFDENVRIARHAEAVAKATVHCVDAALRQARQENGVPAVFGTSPVGTMAPYILGCPEALRWRVDENENTWGCVLGPARVVGPQDMREHGITDVALAISPLYWESVAEKLRAHGVRVHVPHLQKTAE